MITCIADFAPEHIETGVGLALRDSTGRYLFALAGLRHRCPEGELFFSGVGGHRELGESWIECAYREADEEIHTTIELRSAQQTFHINQAGELQQVTLDDTLRPYALYEMVHLPGTHKAGRLYHLVIFEAYLPALPNQFTLDEVQGGLLLTQSQVAQSAERRPSLGEIINEGGALAPGSANLSLETQLYPIGTAKALSLIFQRIAAVPSLI